MITVEDLRLLCPTTRRERLNEFVAPLNLGMKEYEISDTIEREAAFLAQIAWESGGFHYVREIASGEAYENRADLGNTEPGDGARFKGRGLLQITGRFNYEQCGAALGLDLIADPELLESSALAARSACWWWKEHGCNELADREDFKGLTKRINGGYNGFQERLALWERAKNILA